MPPADWHGTAQQKKAVRHVLIYASNQLGIGIGSIAETICQTVHFAFQRCHVGSQDIAGICAAIAAHSAAAKQQPGQQTAATESTAKASEAAKHGADDQQCD